VIVVAYDSGDALTRCLDSLAGEDVVVVNNGGRGPEIADAEARARVIGAGNVGFGAGCNLGARETAADVLVFVNPDTVVQPGAVAALARALEQPDVAIVQARLRLLHDPERLNSSGNVVHVSGLAWPGGYGDPADALSEPREIAYASGAAFAIRRDVFRELGGFTEELFLYQEDLELGWRAHLRGLRAHRLAPGVAAGEGPRLGLARAEPRLARKPPAGDAGAPPGGRPRPRPLPHAGARPADARAALGHRSAQRPRFRVVARRPRLPLTLPSSA